MPINSIDLKKFSVFEKLRLEFCKGLNVFIGENATGKSHLMKLLYSLIKPLEDYNGHKEYGPIVREKLAGVFKPEDDLVRRLVRRTVGISTANGTLVHGGASRIDFSLTTRGEFTFHTSAGKTPRSVFLPTGEALSMYEGFIAAYDQRELSFDETYYDLCKAMTGRPLKGPRMQEAKELIGPLEDILGGRVVLKGGRFHLHSEGEGNIEAHLLAEGHRKIACIAHLIANGTLMENNVLFWDEPEANLNPRLVTKVALMLRSLVHTGVQVFISTHDFLLSQELSLAVEYQTRPVAPTRFFAFSRPDASSPVSVESGDQLADLADDAILQEFAEHYDREQRLFYGEEKEAGARQ